MPAEWASVCHSQSANKLESFLKAIVISRTNSTFLLLLDSETENKFSISLAPPFAPVNMQVYEKWAAGEESGAAPAAPVQLANHWNGRLKCEFMNLMFNILIILLFVRKLCRVPSRSAFLCLRFNAQQVAKVMPCAWAIFERLFESLWQKTSYLQIVPAKCKCNIYESL